MNRHELQQLQQIRDYPSLTITLPTHRMAPANKQDPIRLGNLVTEVKNRLLTEFSKREVKKLTDNLDKLVSQIDYNNTLDGLALLVNENFAHAYYLPFNLKDRVVIDETFATRDLVFALNRTPRYWVLALSEKPTRLYEGTKSTLVEIDEEGFPLKHEGPGGELPLPGGFGKKKSAHRDERHRQFFRNIDSAFKPFFDDDPLPLAVVGVDRYLAFFNEVSQHKDEVVATVTGSHDSTPIHKLGKLVWPHVKESLAQRRRKVLDELEQAMGKRLVVSSPDEVWRLAQEGRGRLLLVEEDFHYPARMDETGLRIEPAENPDEPDVMDDAVDEIVETVLAKQGKVLFMDNGRLADHQRIALILRY